MEIFENLNEIQENYFFIKLRNFFTLEIIER